MCKMMPYSQRLSRAGLGDPHHVPAAQSHREALSLDRCRLLKVLSHQHVQHILCQRTRDKINAMRFIKAQLCGQSRHVMALLTRKLCLVETSEGLGAAGASDGDLLLPAKLFHVVLDMTEEEKHIYCEAPC